MGGWGVKSYENDEADFALDAGFDRVHGAGYEDLMDDRNPMTVDQIQRKLADERTLAAAVESIRAEVGRPWEDWDEEERLGFAGVIVRHAELAVPIPAEWLDRALAWLRDESIEWDEETKRKLRRQKEIDLLASRPAGGPAA